VLVVMADSPWAFASLLNLRPILVAVAVVLVASILFWLPLVLRMTRTLRELMQATVAIAEGRFGTRVQTKRRDEIGVLGHSINRMAGRLDVLVNGQRKFLADVAHELGSPLGRLQVATSILEERVAADLRPQVQDVSEEVEQMSELLNELLAFTKTGLQAREAKLQPVFLQDVIEQAVQREAAPVTLDLAPDLVVRGDAKLLFKVVGNLLRNAVRYGGAEVEIAVRTRRLGRDRAQVLVSDNGPGVPPEALERLGEPFYRPDVARTRSTGGSGLGLSIVRESIAAMRGQVRFANLEPRGFAVTLELVALELGDLCPDLA
jgi:two-component system sensor histidine kinase CpxA